MAVAFNAKSTDTNSGSGVTTFTTSTLTPVAGSNLVIIGLINLGVISGSAPTGITATWSVGSTPMVSAGSFSTVTSTNATGAIFVLPVGSVTTAGTITFNWTGAATPYAQAVCFSGASQAGGTTTCPNFTHNTGASGTAMTLAVTAGANDGALNIGSSDNNSPMIWSATNVGVNLFNDSTGSQNAWADYALGTSVGANPTFNDTGNSSGAAWMQVGCAIAVAVASSSGVTTYHWNLGVNI